MLRSKFTRALVICMCFMVFSSTAAFAGTGANQATEVQEQQIVTDPAGQQTEGTTGRQAGSEKIIDMDMGDGVDSFEGQQAGDVKDGGEGRGVIIPVKPGSPDTSVSSTAPDEPKFISEEMLDKQNEINQYVFEQYKDEIARMGFTVTHTGPYDTYVEIGITPYNEENAEYLYKAFGREMVKVVEGIQATTMEYQILNGQDAEIYASNIVSVDADSAATTATEPLSTTVITVIIAAAVVVLLIGTLFFTRRLRMAGR